LVHSRQLLGKHISAHKLTTSELRSSQRRKIKQPKASVVIGASAQSQTSNPARPRGRGGRCPTRDRDVSWVLFLPLRLILPARSGLGTVTASCRPKYCVPVPHARGRSWEIPKEAATSGVGDTVHVRLRVRIFQPLSKFAQERPHDDQWVCEESRPR
jgi:hypothetical protein